MNKFYPSFQIHRETAFLKFIYPYFGHFYILLDISTSRTKDKEKDRARNRVGVKGDRDSGLERISESKV